jgi:hypothetical protein
MSNNLAKGQGNHIYSYIRVIGSNGKAKSNRNLITNICGAKSTKKYLKKLF